VSFLAEESAITYFPLTPERWADFERLFGPNGACGGCWCTWWRLSQAEFTKKTWDEKKNAFRTIVQSGKEPGILAYVDGLPVGWAALAPRNEYPRLDRSRVLARVDDQPVWSISCFFIDKHYRRLGLTRGLITAAVEYARAHGAAIVEAYPIEPNESSDSGSLFRGVAATFVEAGFVEVARRSAHHPVMRYIIV
jgi:GNAT superfamily N-acetyltransferase